MKYKHKLAKLAARVYFWQQNLARDPGFRKPGSIK